MDNITEIVSFDGNGHALDGNNDRIIVQFSGNSFALIQDPLTSPDKIITTEVDIDRD